MSMECSENWKLGTPDNRLLPIGRRMVAYALIVALMAIAFVSLTDKAVASPESDSYKLVVRTSGFGWVTGPGINCPSRSCEATYAAGTSVTLYSYRTAGSIFGGWAGDCSGNGPCVLVIDGDRFVSATFNEPPPETQITKQRLRPAVRKATFWFNADRGLGITDYYSCRLDGKQWQRCTSPKTYRNLSYGRHVFSVRGVGPDQADPTPAKSVFRIRRPR